MSNEKKATIEVEIIAWGGGGGGAAPAPRCGLCGAVGGEGGELLSSFMGEPLRCHDRRACLKRASPEGSTTCQAEDQGGWPCGRSPVVFQLTAAEVAKRDGEQMYFCAKHRTNKFVWAESESEPIRARETAEGSHVDPAIVRAAERDDAREAEEARLIADPNFARVPVTASASLSEAEEIKAAHPLRSGRHDLYAEAMRLVGERHAKGALVELVTWLLLRAEQARAGGLWDATPSARASHESTLRKMARVTDGSLRAALAVVDALPAPASSNASDETSALSTDVLRLVDAFEDPERKMRLRWLSERVKAAEEAGRAIAQIGQLLAAGKCTEVSIGRQVGMFEVSVFDARRETSWGTASGVRSHYLSATLAGAIDAAARGTLAPSEGVNR
ncbi:MAG: hypothetical protein JWP97_2523 [Labilithrix sp.]|nr:hypothetical protein [Labilithrix sp.]